MRAASCSKRFLTFGIGESRSHQVGGLANSGRVELLLQGGLKSSIIDSERSFDSIMTEDLPNHQLRGKVVSECRGACFNDLEGVFFFQRMTPAPHRLLLFAIDEKYTKGSPRLVNRRAHLEHYDVAYCFGLQMDTE